MYIQVAMKSIAPGWFSNVFSPGQVNDENKGSRRRKTPQLGKREYLHTTKTGKFPEKNTIGLSSIREVTHLEHKSISPPIPIFFTFDNN
jgi:hypothetical protein